jgi:four helix bundle protein
MKNFRDLQVWHKAHQLTLESYKATNGFPKQELFGLTSQIRRAAVSIAANIAEGCGKRGNGETGNFNDFLESLLALQVSLNIISCWHTI